MLWVQRLWLRLQSLLRRQRAAQRLDDEIQFHLEQQIVENIAIGMNQEEARFAAGRAFGNATVVKEETRDTWGWIWFEQFAQDLRYGLRLLLKDRSFTFVAVFTLALGIGSTSVLFSIFDGAYWHANLTDQGNRVVLLAQQSTKQAELWRFSAPEYFDIVHQGDYRFFDGFFAIRYWNTTLSEGSGRAENPQRMMALRVSSNFFNLYGISPILGRTFTAGEDTPGGPNVAVITYKLWKIRFNLDPAIIGRTIRLNGTAYMVVGVTPRRFGYWGTDVAIPLALDPAASNRSERSLMVAGIAKAGVSAQQTRPELEFLAHRMESTYGTSEPEYAGLVYNPIDVRKGVAGDFPTALYILFGAVAILALITSANVACLLIVRTIARAGEIGTRLALGANPVRLARQFLTENILLSLAAGAVGIAVGASALKPMLALIPARYIGDEPNIHTDSVALLLSISAALFLGVLFGLAPALFVARRDVDENLRQGRTRSSTDRGGARMRTALVFVEMALAFVVVMGAALMVRTYERLTSMDFGFRADHVLTMRIGLPESKYAEASKVTSFFRELQQRVRSLPAVVTVAASSARPVDSAARRDFSIPGRSLNTANDIATAGYRVITPDYFAVVHTPLRNGRSFTDQDSSDTLSVAIVNESFARTYFPNEEVLGRQIRLENRYISTAAGMQWPGNQAVQVVGVVADSRQITPFMDLHDFYQSASPEIFVPFQQHPEGGRDMALLVRITVAPGTLADAVRNDVLAIDRGQPVYDVQTLEDMVETAFGPTRLCLVILSIFAGAALLTACVGLYAIVSYSVMQRRHEIGIRMALGAKPSDALRLVACEGIPVIMAGLFVGLLASLGVTRFMSSLLYGVLPNDRATLLTVTGILSVTAILAVYLPARRAVRVDPMEALRYE